jgi:hypothetical protein
MTVLTLSGAGVSAGDIINGALRLLGQLAEGETPSAETSADALLAMNQMLDSWSIERLSVFATRDDVFTWPANTIKRTYGPTGDFVGARPVLLDDSTYFKDTASGLSYDILFINQDQYNGIALKTAGSTFPQVMWVNMTYPDVEMYLYPRPTKDLEFHLVSVQELAQPATLATILAFPPGYLRAFRYCLAMELAPEFGVEPSMQVQRIAMVSKRNLKRINNPDDIMAMPYSLVNRRRQRFNIFSGGY